MVSDDKEIIEDEADTGIDDSFDLRVLAAVVIVAVLIAASFFATQTGFNNGPTSTPFSGTGPQISLVPTPNVVGIGSSVALEAYLTGYQPDATVSVAVTVSGPPGSNLVSSDTLPFTTNSNGAGSTIFSYPAMFSSASTTAPGIYTVSSTFSGVYTIGTVETSFTVFDISNTNTPEVTLSPAHDPSGAKVTFSGNYFAPNSNITLKDGTTTIVTSPAAIKTGATGSFSGTFNVQLPAGRSFITVSDQQGNSVSVPFYQEAYASSGALVQSSTTTYVQSGNVYANLQGPGVILTVSGSTSLTDTAVTATASVLNGMSQSITQNPPGNAVAFYDVSISGISSGTATISITNSSVISTSAVGGLYYWTGSQWKSASNVTVSGSTVSGQIPVSDLSGTELVLVPPTQPATPIFDYVIIAAVIVVVLGATAVAVTRRRRGRGGSGDGKSKGKQQIERMTVSRSGKK